MNKFKKGDIVIFTREAGEGTIARVENWRGGGVAPYVVRILEPRGGYNYSVGQITYMSGRNMELKDMETEKCSVSCEEKIDLILNHLGLEFKVEPRKLVLVEKEINQRGEEEKTEEY